MLLLAVNILIASFLLDVTYVLQCSEPRVHMHRLLLIFRTSLLGVFMQGLLFNNLNCWRIGTLIPNNRGNLFFFTRSILFVDDDLIYLFRCIMLINFIDTLLSNNDRIVLRRLGLRDVYFTIFFR